MKILKILALSLITITLSGKLSCSAYNAYIPEATMKAALEGGLNDEISSDQTVRVGIGNNNFSTYQYSEITIYGTGDTKIFDNGVPVADLNAQQTVKIKINDGTFNIYTPENNSPEQLNGPIQIKSLYGLLGVSGLKRAGKPALYHGTFELVKANNSKFNLVNIIDVEDYLKGVVPNEMPVDFGLEALKAQCVAARNYVLSPRVKSSPNYDVVDSVASQVYFGANTEKPLATQAVQETEGIVALYDRELILAQYSSTAGGYTESFANAFSDPKTKEFPSHGKPYLVAKPDIISQTPLNTEEAAKSYYKSRPDSYDIRSPYFRWQREWKSDELRDVLQNNLPAQSATGFVKPTFKKGDKLDDLTAITVKKRGNSGKIIEMEIVTKSQTYKVYKELVIRRLFTKNGKALPSANVVFENITDETGENLSLIKAYGGGFGHGVGMSQYGAGFMGKELHLTFDKILKHYYDGISLTTKPVILSCDLNQQHITQKFYAPKKYAKIIIDNKYGISKLKVEINGHEKIIELPKEFLGYKRYCETDISRHIKTGENIIKFSSPDLSESSVNKGLRLYVELVKKDDNKYIW